MEQTELEKLFGIVRSLFAEKDKITANRMSIINGQLDFTEFSNIIAEKSKEYVDVYNDKLDGKISKIEEIIVRIIMSEVFYQSDDCFNALIQINSALAFLEAEGNEDVWAVAKYVQMCIMIVSGQLRAIYPLVDGMKNRIINSKNQQLIDNYEALRAWCALYDDDWDKVDDWINNIAPNEYDEIELKDTFALFAKARIYYMRGQNLAVITIMQSIKKLLNKNARYMELCELYMLLAMALDAEGRCNEAYINFGKCLEIAKERNFIRLLADEGEPIFRLSRGFLKNIDKDDEYYGFVQEIRKRSKDMALMYPRYLKNHKQDYQRLTKKEEEILKLIVDERTNVEIADFLGNSVNTIKYHLKNIFNKLGVNNRAQAVKVALEERLIK